MSSPPTAVPMTTTVKNVQKEDPMQDPKVLSIIGALSGIIVVLLGMIGYYAYRPYRKREELTRFVSYRRPDSVVVGNENYMGNTRARVGMNKTRIV